MKLKYCKKWLFNSFSCNAIAYYSVIIGVIILTKWLFILYNGEIAEGKGEITLHIISEFLMATISVFSGFMIFEKIKIGLFFNLVAQSMIIYSVLNAIGYYMELDDYVMISLLFLTLILSFYFMVFLVYYFNQNLFIKDEN
jgi:hypothetical protein